MPSTSITFEGATGATLAGRLELPTGAPRGVALLAHCFTCSKDLSGLVRIAKALVLRGFAVFRFDFTGLGESEGTLAEGNFAMNVGDLVAAARYLEQHIQAPALLVGHSLGGTAGLLAAAQMPSVRAIVTIGAPADPSRVLRLSADERALLDRDGVVQVSLAGRSFEITREFVEALRHDSLVETIGGLRRALLVIHAPRDQVVGIDSAAAIFKAAKHPKSFISLDDGDHLLTRPEDANYVAEVISSWACRYIPAPSTPSAEAAISLRGADLVAAIDRDHYRTRLHTAMHSWIADEPASHHGTDLGPTPYEMVMGGLAACTSITLRMYADRKGWPVEEVMTRVDFEYVTVEEAELSGKEKEKEKEKKKGKKKKIGKFSRRVELVGDLDETQRHRLLEIADRCPIHRILTAANQVLTSEEPALSDGED